MHDGEQPQDRAGSGPGHPGPVPGPPPGAYPPPGAGFPPPRHGGYPGPPPPATHGFTQTPWPAPPAGDGAPVGVPRSRGALLGGIVAAAVVIAAIVVAVTGFWVPGYFTYTVLDTESVENGITEHLRTAGESVDVGSVNCPGDIRVRVDDTFTCTLAIDGESHTVTSTILDEDGTYRVGAPAAR